MSKLREAAQAVGAWAVECDGDLVDVYLTETAAKLVEENMRETNRGRDFAWRVVPLVPHTHPSRGEWRPASEPPEDGRRVLIWVATESGGETFRPAYCPAGGWTSVFDGETLVAWRDVTPPMEGS